MKVWCFWLATTGCCLFLVPLFALGLLFRGTRAHGLPPAAPGPHGR